MTATPYETSGNTVTSLATETSWVNAMVAANPTKVTKQTLGNSYNGYPIYALRFGAGTGRPIVLQTSVHSDENAPREAVFALVRDLCETAHPWSALLAARQLIIVPTANPDGIPFTRNNGAGMNINRCFLNRDPLAPEATVLGDFYYSVDPVAILDGHEWPQHDNGTTAQVGTTTRVLADTNLISQCTTVGNAILTAINGGGWTFDLAPSWYQLATPAGALTDWTGHVGIVGVVIETMSTTATIGPKRAERVAQQALAQRTFLDHAQSDAATWDTVSATARAAAAAKVSGGNYEWTLDLHNYALTSTSPPPANPPAVSAVAYTVGTADMALVGPVLDAHGIAHGGVNVSLSQQRATIAAILLDPLSSTPDTGDGTRIASATRVAPDPVQIVRLPNPSPNPAKQLWSSLVG